MKDTNLEDELKTAAEVPAEALATLVEIGEEINSSLDLDEVLAHTAALIQRLIDYEIFAVLLLDEAGRELKFRFAIGHRQEVVDNWRIPIGTGITGTAAATGEAVRVADVSKDPRYLNALDAVRSELAVPLVVKEKTIGVLDIQSRQLDYFTPEQQDILTLLASRLAGAIENARLYESQRRQSETLLLLHEVGREASSVLDVSEVLRRAAGLFKRVIDFQIFSILLLDEDQNLFRHAATVKFGQSVAEKSTVRMGEGIVGAAAVERKPVLVPDVTREPRYLAVNPETRSELAVPMFYQDRVVGVLDLQSPQPNYFNEEHVQALSILAAQLAISIQNARLYERVARDEARMERELLAARRIQGVLFPPVPAADFGLDLAARLVSARELCGDVYDFPRYGPQELGIAIGDVSGKGTAAALYGAVATGILRSLATRKLPPGEALRELNQLIGERRVEGRFMTMCIATWHKGKRKLRIANAGQTQPLVYKNGTTEAIRVEGFPLGLYGDATYEEKSLALDPGDILIFHSDGLSETMNAKGQEFGVSRLRQLVTENAGLSSNELADLLLAAVDEYAGISFAADDRTLVVAKVK